MNLLLTVLFVNSTALAGLGRVFQAGRWAYSFGNTTGGNAMQPWITVTASVVLFFASLGAQFYFKWVPKVDDQKRHVKHAFIWLVSILCVFCCIGSLYGLTQRKGVITPGSLVEVSLVAASTFFIIVLIGAQHLLVPLIDRMVDLLSRQMNIIESNADHIDRLTTLAGLYRDAIFQLANDEALSSEMRDSISLLLAQESNPSTTIRNIKKAHA